MPGSFGLAPFLPGSLSPWQLFYPAPSGVQMDFLADTWILWIILTVVIQWLMRWNRQNRGSEKVFITSAEEFSIKTVLFDVKKGEGDIFIGGVLSFVFFSLFLAGFIRWVTTIF